MHDDVLTRARRTQAVGNTTGSTIVNGHLSASTGILFESGLVLFAGFHFSGATYDSSGIVLDLAAGTGVGIVEKTAGANITAANFNVLSGTTVYPCDPTSNDVQANLPARSSIPNGYSFKIFDAKGSSGAFRLKLSPNGSDVIRNANAVFSLPNTAYAGAIVVNSQSGWCVMLTT